MQRNTEQSIKVWKYMTDQNSSLRNEHPQRAVLRHTGKIKLLVITLSRTKEQ